MNIDDGYGLVVALILLGVASESRKERGGRVLVQSALMSPDRDPSRHRIPGEVVSRCIL